MRTHAFNTVNILASFRKAGIWPVNRELIIKPLRERQEYQEQAHQQYDRPPSSPPIATGPLPRTSRSRRRAAERVGTRFSKYRNAVSSPTFNALTFYVEALEASAAEGDLLAEKVAETEAATKKRREIRDNAVGSKRLKVLITGGVMYAEDGREQSKTRAELKAKSDARIIAKYEAKKAKDPRDIEEEIMKGIRKVDRQIQAGEKAFRDAQEAKERAEKKAQVDTERAEKKRLQKEGKDARQKKREAKKAHKNLAKMSKAARDSATPQNSTTTAIQDPASSKIRN